MHLNNGVENFSALEAKKQKVAIKKWLDQIRDKFLSLKVISITLDNQDDAYTIFETMNTRGKDLTAADLAKNHILRLLPAKGKSLDRPKDHWLEMQEELEGATRPIQLKTFLHHYWLSKYPFTTEKQLFRAIRDTVNAGNVKEVVAELRTDTVLYKGITDPNSLTLWTKPGRDIADSLYCISNILNIQIANPFLLSVLRLYSAKRLKDGQVRELFGLVERYHYIYTTISALPSSGGVSQMYAAHARDLANAVDANALGLSIQDFKKKIKDRVPSKEVFVSKFKQLTYQNTRQRDVLRYTLWKIDKHRNPAVDFERGTATFEHLLSQSTNSAMMHSIGNLILVPGKFNGETLGNKPFLEKKGLLQGNGYALDDHVAVATAWGSTEIEKRLNMLADYAYEHVWKIK